jgi:hypothetical protein
MIGWIGAEIIVLPAPARSWTEVLYLGTGLKMFAFGTRLGLRTVIADRVVTVVALRGVGLVLLRTWVSGRRRRRGGDWSC